MLIEKIIWAAHKKTMHRGVTITMSSIRTYYWIPSLRKITKFIIKECHNCARYRAMSFQTQKPGPLSKQRTQKCNPFQVIGVDYAGPIYYKSKNKAISKSYILSFSCSVSRAIHQESIPNLTTQEFIKQNGGVLRGFILTVRRHSRL